MSVRDPIRAWREQYGRQMLNLDFQPLSDVPFYANFRPIVGGMPIVRSWLSPGLTTRDDELVRDGDDSLTLLISNTKGLEASQRGRSTVMGNGDATLLCVDSPGHVGINRHFGMDAIMFSRAEFLERVPRAIDATVARIPRNSEPLRLLRTYMRALEKQPVDSAPLRDVVRRHILELAGLSITFDFAAGETSLESVAAARTAAAIEHIGEHFREPDLSLGSAANALCISARYLQKLFERSGTNFTAEVNRVRLDHAYELLRNGAAKVSDIALQCGFSDVSHFNRLFRARFGETPRGLRAARRLQGPGAEN